MLPAIGGIVKFDGQRSPIQAQARLAANEIVFEKLFTTARLKNACIKLVTGQVGPVVAGGEVSNVAMVETGPRMDSDCGRLIAGVQRPVAKAGR